jgi:VWFA-related protein
VATLGARVAPKQSDASRAAALARRTNILYIRPVRCALLIRSALARRHGATAYLSGNNVSSDEPFFRIFPVRLRLSALAFAALLCLFNVARAQDDEPIRVESNLVILNVGVADQKGKAVTDLTRGDFNVYEDGVKQSIVSFEPAASPFSLVLLLDMSGSTRNFRLTLKQSAIRFIDALGPEDRVAVVAFNDKIKTLQGFTTDHRKVAFAIDYLAEGTGNTNLYQGAPLLARTTLEGGQAPQGVVVLTTGSTRKMGKLDRQTSAQASTIEEANAAVKPEQARRVRSVLDSADRLGVTVYPLALPSADPKKLLPLTPQQAAVYTAARARMQSSPTARAAASTRYTASKTWAGSTPRSPPTCARSTASPTSPRTRARATAAGAQSTSKSPAPTPSRAPAPATTRAKRPAPFTGSNNPPFAATFATTRPA